MSELAQSVIVCNIEGRILLYNARAMQLLRKPLDGAARAGQGAEPGRARALDLRDLRPQPHHPCARQHPRPPAPGHARPGGELRHHRARGAARAGADGAGLGAAPASRERPPTASPVSCCVLDDITRRIESGNRRDLLLQTLTQGTRARSPACAPRSRRSPSFPDMDKDGAGTVSSASSATRRSSLSAQLDRDRQRVRRLAAHRVAARGHARRRPDRGGAAADRDEASGCRRSSRPSTSRSGSRSTATR